MKIALESADINLTSVTCSLCAQAIKDNSTGRALWWEPEYTYNTADPRITATLPCVPESAEMLYTTDAGAAMYNNTDYPMFGGVEVPCIDGNQVGMIFAHILPVGGPPGILSM